MVHISVDMELGFPGGSDDKESARKGIYKEGDAGSLGWEETLEKGMATHSSIITWRIPRTEEPEGVRGVHGGHKESDTTERLTAQQTQLPNFSE